MTTKRKHIPVYILNLTQKGFMGCKLTQTQTHTSPNTRNIGVGIITHGIPESSFYKYIA